MPNHITNILTIEGVQNDRLREILEAIKSDEHGVGSIDFNKINPMPPELDIPASSEYMDAYAVYLAQTQGDYRRLDSLLEIRGDAQTRKELMDNMLKNDPELLSKGERYARNMKNHGAATWYEWCSSPLPGHWGTKWNAYDFAPYEDGSGVLRFLTAWNSPEPILQKLSVMFPDAQFRIAWADEDFGYNVGEKLWSNGETMEWDVPTGGSKEAYEMAAEITGEELPDRGLFYSEETGTYEYMEQDEDEDEDMGMGGLS
jgi:hypothetical protein